MAGSFHIRPISSLAVLAAAIIALVLWAMAGEEARELQPLEDSGIELAQQKLAAGSPAREKRANLPAQGEVAEEELTESRDLPPHAITLKLEGRVTDAHTGQGIADAKVMLTDEAPASRVFAQMAAEAPAPFVRSDAEGYYRADSTLTEFRALAYAWHPEYIVSEKSILNRSRAADGSGPAVDFALTPRSNGASLSGKIVHLVFDKLHELSPLASPMKGLADESVTKE